MLKVLNLKNFKCFEKQEFGLGNLTLLTGLNGMGKSTVMQSLLSLRQSYEQNLLPKTGLSLNGDWVNLGKASDLLFEDAQEDIIGISLELSDSRKAEFKFDYIGESDVIKLNPSSQIDNTFFSDESLFNDDFQYLGAERVGPRVAYSVSDFSVRQHRRLGTQGQFTAYYISIFGEQEANSSLFHPLAPSNSLKNQIEAWISEVTPGTQIHTTHQPGIDLVSLQYSFARGASGVTKPFRSTNVGFGITYTLPVITALLTAKPGDLLLIENPEAHLHPRGQRKIGELISLVANLGVQVIVESHSDHVLNGIRIATHENKIKPDLVKIHFFSIDYSNPTKKTQVVTPNLDADGRIDRWPDGFFDEWDKTLDQLLTPKK